MALTAAAVLAATGALTAVLYVDHIPQLWQTGYGRVLLLKIRAVRVDRGDLGAFNWRWVRPATDGGGRPRPGCGVPAPPSWWRPPWCSR